MYRSACLICFLTSLAATHSAADDKPSTQRRPRLPGVQSDGTVLLPNQWSLRPAGRQLELGDFPVNMALHPSGLWLAVLHAGYGEHEVVIVGLQEPVAKISCRVRIDQGFYGLCFSPDGKHLYASGGEFEVVHAFEFDGGLLSRQRSIAVAPRGGIAGVDQAKRMLALHRVIPRAPGAEGFVVGGLAIDAPGKTLFVVGTWGSAVVIVPLAEQAERQSVSLPDSSYPYACLPEPAGKRLFVSLWNKAAIAVIDLEKKTVSDTWPCERHPTEMVLGPAGKDLFVACANSTRVCRIDTTTGKSIETLACSLYPNAPTGNTPNSLCLTPDGDLLFVANADANNIAVFRIAPKGPAQPLGFVPSGWYPTSVRYNRTNKKLYIANGKGLSSRANPQGPNPLLPRNATTRQYIGSLFRGALSIVDMPTEKQMAPYSQIAYACSPLRSDQGVSSEPSAENPIPRKLGAASPITHCLYIIKENRTYDQVLGDLKEGNGDPNLCIFPDSVTPNHHRLAREFVLLDNFYVDGEVSADGHEWSMGAYATDFVEKVWPLNYRGSPLHKLAEYPSEGNMDANARPAGGYIWDRCAEAGVSYRSYGEWIANGANPGDPGRARVKALEGHFDPLFRGFDLDYSDQKRAERFIKELARFEREDSMPSLVILRLPNDHTSGARVGMPTPTAFLADNDLALGRVIEAVSKSKFWKSMAVFIVEDDAQNGSDHVDAHRTVAYVISPYVKRGFVDSQLYSTSSLLRTMELILGLKPMSQFDAAARPMYESFRSQADLRPYRHLVPAVDLNEKNQRSAWGAQLSEALDFSQEDAADDLVLNEIIWRSVRGPSSAMPAPVRAAFVFPHLRAR